MLLHNVTCYTHSLLSCIHGYILNVTYTLVATCMIVERSECSKLASTLNSPISVVEN